MSARETFERALADAYARLYDEQPDDYALARARYTPVQLAEKMTAGLADGTASKDGPGVRAACRAVGIKTTYRAIRAYLSGGAL